MAAISVYRVDRETDRLEVKPERLKELIANRQYAALGDQHMVAAFPNSEGGYAYLALSLADRVSHRLNEEPPADQPELRTLWTALQSEFGDVLRSRGKVQRVTDDSVADRQQIVPASVTN